MSPASSPENPADVADAPASESPAVDPAPVNTAAAVRFHLKGDPVGSGPVYQGQEILIPCINCGYK